MSAALEQAWRAVEADPDDLARLEVLCDLMLQEADPAAELIRLSIELTRAPSLADRLLPRIESLRGPITHSLGLSGRSSWRNGLLDTANVVGNLGLRKLCARPEARLLRLLEFAPADRDHLTDTNEQLEALPQNLAEISIWGAAELRSIIRMGWPRRVLAAMRHLRRLSVRSMPIDLSGARSKTLEHLVLDSDQFADLVVEGLGNARFPCLSRLELTSGRARWPTPFVAGEATPALATLVIRGMLLPQHLEDLAASGLLRRLSALELEVQHLPHFDEILGDTADRFDHLKRFRRPVPR